MRSRPTGWAESKDPLPIALQGIFQMKIRERIPCRIIFGSGPQGSFDSVAASLREAASPLKMTVLW